MTRQTSDLTGQAAIRLHREVCRAGVNFFLPVVAIDVKRISNLLLNVAGKGAVQAEPRLEAAGVKPVVAPERIEDFKQLDGAELEADRGCLRAGHGLLDAADQRTRDRGRLRRAVLERGDLVAPPGPRPLEAGCVGGKTQIGSP